MVSKGQIVGIDWNRIAQLHSHVLAHMNSLTASRCHIKASHIFLNIFFITYLCKDRKIPQYVKHCS